MPPATPDTRRRGAGSPDDAGRDMSAMEKAMLLILGAIVLLFAWRGFVLWLAVAAWGAG